MIISTPSTARPTAELAPPGPVTGKPVGVGVGKPVVAHGFGVKAGPSRRHPAGEEAGEVEEAVGVVVIPVVVVDVGVVLALAASSISGYFACAVLGFALFGACLADGAGFGFLFAAARWSTMLLWSAGVCAMSCSSHPRPLRRSCRLGTTRTLSTGLSRQTCT